MKIWGLPFLNVILQRFNRHSFERIQKHDRPRGVQANSDFYKDNRRKRRIQVNTWKGTLALERRLFLAGYYKAFGLVSESCALCKTCTYPQECKFPRDRRPSVESCSIDIFRTLGSIDKQFRISQSVASEYNCYSIILLE